MRLYIVAFCAAFLTSCIPNYAEMSPREISTIVKARYADDGALREVSGPAMHSAVDNVAVYYKLKAEEDGRQMHHYMYIKVVYNAGAWDIFEDAHVGGRAMHMREIKREVDGCKSEYSCSFIEQLAIDMKESYIRSSKGMDIRVRSRSGVEVPLAVHPNYIKAYLMKYDEVRR